MSLVAVAAIPAAPLLVPAVSPRQPAAVADEVTELRTAVGQVLSDLPAPDTIVLLAAGPIASVAGRATADLTGYGHPQARTELPVDPDLWATTAAIGSAGAAEVDRQLSGDLAVLTLLVAAVRPGAPVLPVSVGGDLAVLGAGLSRAIRSSSRRVAVVAAGDLAAGRDTTSPGYLVDGAVAWDEAAVAALARGDVAALRALGPTEAERVGARGWAALVVLLQLAAEAGLQLGAPRSWAPRGVGQLVVASR